MLTPRTLAAFTALALAGCHCCSRPVRYQPIAPERIPPVRDAALVPALPAAPCPSCPAGQPAVVAVAPPAPGVRLAVPQAGDVGGPEQTLRLFAPEPAGPAQVRPQSPEPPRARLEETTRPPSLPVGIPQFAVAKEKPRVASGLKPSGEGLDWLAANGYKAVLFLHPPAQDDTAERTRVEAKPPLRYLSLAVAPETLTADLLSQFNKLVNDPANQPLFVYDADGVVAGGLWYLHLYQGEGLPEAKARAEAIRLGLRDDPAGDQGTMWVAVQKLLSTLKP
jgi:hypothetical protein